MLVVAVVEHVEKICNKEQVDLEVVDMVAWTK
jgi:hypothetical protein